ncbi:gamma-glutamylcyclotransferase [Defluviimonas sp. WL0002]|uniref:Gamma-glutamylcyclotransferase n=1 Tax=Albidovulum marisflavi TaxID=2984159 RepID=A0ABT2ZBK9_9RHOB|nr:gamma-glutamylcyclotransferase family protein [Defluviimonas sp. WL0002]MCV2868476.1 gamma-glutamylcyclotransferase [Defluviimonas sp. WL0002]
MTNARHPAFFGYGSLVNRATHDHAPSAPVTLSGWRRVWRQTVLRPYAFLSVEPAESEIQGLVAAVPDDDWAALDRRESAYLRHSVSPASLSAPDWAETVQIYAVDDTHHAPDASHPILLSYLDVVVQGFLREFGRDGARGFFATTTGWSAIHDDRAAPIYPRHQALTGTERRLVDDCLDEWGIVRLPG